MINVANRMWRLAFAHRSHFHLDAPDTLERVWITCTRELAEAVTDGQETRQALGELVTEEE